MSPISRRTFTGAALAAAAAGMQRPVSYGLDALLTGEGFVHIPAGEFQMGSASGRDDEAPVRRVTISRAFDIGRTEVTQAQWEAAVTDPHAKRGTELRNEQGSPMSAKPSQFEGPSLPVENVSWYDVEFFLRRLNARDKKHHYRLPTEAEWEYACLAGSRRSGSGSIADTAWHKANSGERTHPTGEKQPNAWGLHDVDGNVAEWVQDWYAPDYYSTGPTTDPQGPQTGSYRVFRGGSWIDEARYCTPSHRRFELPANHLSYVGFRVVRVLW